MHLPCQFPRALFLPCPLSRFHHPTPLKLGVRLLLCPNQIFPFYVRDRETEELAPICQLCSSNTQDIHRQSRELGSHFGSPTWMAESQTLKPSLPPPRVCISGKLEPRVDHGHLHVGCENLGCPNHHAKGCFSPSDLYPSPCTCPRGIRPL